MLRVPGGMGEERPKKWDGKSEKKALQASPKGEEIPAHHLDDVQAPDELAGHVELRVGRPVGEGFEALPDLLVREHVEAAEGDAVPAQDLHHLPAEPCRENARRSNAAASCPRPPSERRFSTASSRELCRAFSALSTASNHTEGQNPLTSVQVFITVYLFIAVLTSWA